jgi:uncharacterized protein (UPF0297 family)
MKPPEKNFKISVEDADIRHGENCNREHCAIALALKNKGYEDVNVDWDYVKIHNNYYFVSKRARNFIRRFDDGLDVRPSTFILKIARVGK